MAMPREILEAVRGRDATAAAMDLISPSTALYHIWAFVRHLNTKIGLEMPWNAGDGDRRKTLGACLEGIRFLGNLVEPFMPERAVELRRQIGVSGPARWPQWGEHGIFSVGAGTPLFPRKSEEK